jgi:hypothetical protein
MIGPGCGPAYLSEPVGIVQCAAAVLPLTSKKKAGSKK